MSLGKVSSSWEPGCVEIHAHFCSMRVVPLGCCACQTKVPELGVARHLNSACAS